MWKTALTFVGGGVVGASLGMLVGFVGGIAAYVIMQDQIEAKIEADQEVKKLNDLYNDN